tara:strand:+ start:360 stop:629 length:270 start_codon:yes stop_codon:yes gene_type:complete
MNYDNYKLATPDHYDNDLVSSCCGSGVEDNKNSNCCDAPFYGETDICFECKEHAEEIGQICSSCNDECDDIDECEYNEKMKEHYSDSCD